MKSAISHTPRPPATPTQKDVLIVFAKAPVPGHVKTRLTSVLTEEEAARLYAAFLRDALDQYTALGMDVRLYWGSPPDAVPDDLAPADVQAFEQQGEGLGARMQRAFLETFAAGYERVIIIGTDHPTLPSAFIEQAFAALQEPLAVTIGPSEDGGYYLLGMNEFYPQLFADMEYSHADVFRETLARAGGTSAALTVLPPWYDVDTPDALRRLRADLEDPDVWAPHTRRVLGEIAD
ncbi:MAG: TIGR04282 family arsenosugar biosynthesis glycosyltransferase [Rhodothermales bacterium]